MLGAIIMQDQILDVINLYKSAFAAEDSIGGYYDFFYYNDTEALNIVYDLIEKQKIVLGGSSGVNIAGAIKLAKKMGPGKTIVTILCDNGKRYASKIFNKEFLKSKKLPIPNWL